MNKSALIKKIIGHLSDELALYHKAARAAHDEATHEQSKAENKYDTRGLEASYLAAGQAELVEELEWALGKFDAVSFAAIPSGGEIAPGALVLVQTDLGRAAYLLAPAGGGAEVVVPGGTTVTVLGPEAPLRHQLLGRVAGASLERPRLRILEVL